MRPSANRFQPFNHTQPNRYPWLFSYVREALGDDAGHRLLSFGCSIGDEVFALRSYFPSATIKGIDIDLPNIAECRRRVPPLGMAEIEFAVADSMAGEPAGSYDAIFCLAVLCNGTLTVTDAQRSDPILYFANFERMVEDFARCLKPGGFLCLVTTNFRFCDTKVAGDFEVVLTIADDLLAPDILFDRDNRRMAGARYAETVFRKR